MRVSNLNEEFIIKSVIDGKSAKVKDMLAEFHEQNQDNSAYAPVIRFSDDIMRSKNAVSFLCQIKDLCPVAIFETIFPKDVMDPGIIVNSIINYLNVYPKTNNQFILKIYGTDEKQRKEKFDGKAHGLSDIAKMFTKQPLSKKKPILEISADEIDAHRLADYFSPDKFTFTISKDIAAGSKKIEKAMKAAGFEPAPVHPADELF